MEERLFSILYVNHLKIDDLYGLTRTTVELSEPIQSSMNPLTKTAFDNLKKINIDLENRMKKMKGSIQTLDLDRLNIERNNIFREIKRFVSNASKSSSPTLKTPGIRFKEFLFPYWNTEEEPLNTITELYEELIARYWNSEALRDYATTIGIPSLMGDLEGKNKSYHALYLERNTEVSTKAGCSASKIRRDVVKTYELYCATMEQSVNLIPSPEIEKLFIEMDGLRKKYAVLKPKPRKKMMD